jgi:WD40 repeat protein
MRNVAAVSSNRVDYYIVLHSLHVQASCFVLKASDELYTLCMQFYIVPIVITHMLYCMQDRNVRIYSLTDLSLTRTLSRHRDSVTDIKIAGSRIVTSGLDRQVVVWSIEGVALHSFVHTHEVGTSISCTANQCPSHQRLAAAARTVCSTASTV